jgi:hypothetical protein
MKAVLKTSTLPENLLVTLTLALALCYGCSSNPNSSSKTVDSAETKSVSDTDGNALPKNPDGMILVRGTVTSASPKKIMIKTKDTTQTITLTDSLRIYAPSPGNVADVKNTSFIGVTTQKQADKSDQATEIHIFPEELRGLGEGSFMMDTTMGTSNRMTNGAASRMTNGTASRMTNGAASRMTNGSVQKANESSLVIQYQGKSRTVQVPANTTVTTYKATNQKLSAGDKVVALAKKDAKGNYSSDKILIARK